MCFSCCFLNGRACKFAAECTRGDSCDRSEWVNLGVIVFRLIGTFHSPVDGSLVPDSATSSLHMMRHSSMSKVILHPASQNLRVDTNDEYDSPGTMWASVILWGSHGMSRLHVLVDRIRDPSGSLILSGLVDGCCFLLRNLEL